MDVGECQQDSITIGLVDILECMEPFGCFHVDCATGIYSNLPLKYAPVYVRILVKYATSGKKFRVQDLLVEHVVNHHLA